MEKTLHFVVLALIGLILYSCASMGRPEGGAIDKLPPVFVKGTPAPNSLNVKGHKVELLFDELIQLKDQNDKVVISPVQKEQANVRAQGRKVVIEFKDTLIPNTTYSIDFSDAIQDLNESNPIDGFSYAFATGDSIDSLQISGIVLNARDLEPQQKMVVGIHANLNDSAFHKVPFARISRTNDLGQFTIRNLKPGSYRLFAINDANRDYKFDNPSEDIAFYNDIIIPSATSVGVIDTLFTTKGEIDTIINATHTKYVPNDILLSMFNEGYKAQYLVKHERQDKQRLYFEFAAPADTLPSIKLINYDTKGKDWYKINRSLTNDSITYWITDTLIASKDSLTIEAKYLRTDTTQKLSYTTDTLQLNLRKIKIKKPKKEDLAKDSVPKIEFLGVSIKSSSTHDIDAPVTFVMPEPIDSINAKGIRLEMKQDSTWKLLGNVALNPDFSYNLLNYNVNYDWEPGVEYQLTVDSAAIYGIYGKFNKGIKHVFKVKPLEEYSDLILNVNVKDSAFVELLGTDDKPVRIAPVVNGVAEFLHINPNTYYLRIVLDRNNNGKYDTGNYDRNEQPEEVYYYPRKFKLKKNWELVQPWDIYSTAVDLQKPEEIKKNKAVDKNKWDKKEKDKKKTEEEEDEENPFGKNMFDQGKNLNNSQNFGR